MNIVNLIKKYNNSAIDAKARNEIHLIRIINMIISELSEKESTKIIDSDRMMLIKMSHDFYSPDVNEQKREECLNGIIRLLVIYSEGENDIQNIETELSKLVRV